MTAEWKPGSWREREARQQPDWPDRVELDTALDQIRAYPALVTAAHAHALKARIAEAQAGRAFVLQGGDCAESFAGFSTDSVRAGIALLSGIAGRLEAAGGMPVTRVARIAGQFAKPRSRSEEELGGRRLPIFRGDIINGSAFEEAARKPQPSRLFQAYAQSAATLALLSEPDGEEVYTGHEALLLPWEESLIRRDGAGWFGSSGHFLWIGDRTRFEGSAHVELLRGLTNPIGIKCGPSLDPDLLLRLLDGLNPVREPGRITLIVRMGADRIEAILPPLLRSVAAAGHPVLWCCDPMHGNSRRTAGGMKTRSLQAILAELAAFFDICRSEGAVPGGLHVEMTAREVTECTGAGIGEVDLANRYESLCDPRLNPAQAAAVAEAAAGALARGRNAAAA